MRKLIIAGALALTVGSIPAHADPNYAVWCMKSGGRLYDCTVSRGGGTAPVTRVWMAWGPSEYEDAMAWLRQYCGNRVDIGWYCPGEGRYLGR
jgi:hypothetical protein